MGPKDGKSFCLPFSLAGIHLICYLGDVTRLMLQAAGLCTTSVDLCHLQVIWEWNSFLHNRSSASSASERAPAPAVGCTPRISHGRRKGGIPQPQGCSAVAEVSLPAGVAFVNTAALCFTLLLPLLVKRKAKKLWGRISGIAFLYSFLETNREVLIV